MIGEKLSRVVVYYNFTSKHSIRTRLKSKSWLAFMSDYLRLVVARDD